MLVHDFNISLFFVPLSVRYHDLLFFRSLLEMALEVLKLRICKSSHFVVILDEFEVLILPFLTNSWVML